MYDWVSTAPSLSDLIAKAEEEGRELFALIEEEKPKRYLALRGAGTRNEEKVLIQNPAIMSYQSYNSHNQPKHKIFITRVKPTPAPADAGGRSRSSKGWISKGE